MHEARTETTFTAVENTAYRTERTRIVSLFSTVNIVNIVVMGGASWLITSDAFILIHHRHYLQSISFRKTKSNLKSTWPGKVQKQHKRPLFLETVKWQNWLLQSFPKLNFEGLNFKADCELIPFLFGHDFMKSLVCRVDSVGFSFVFPILTNELARTHLGLWRHLPRVIALKAVLVSSFVYFKLVLPWFESRSCYKQMISCKYSTKICVVWRFSIQN